MKTNFLRISFILLLTVILFSCAKDEEVLLDYVLNEKPLPVLTDSTKTKPNVEEEEEEEEEKEEVSIEEPLPEETPVPEEVPIIIPEPTIDDKRLKGASYCGPYTISEPLILNGLNNMVISGLDINNPDGHAISIINCQNIVVENNFLHNSSGNGVQIYGSSNITIRDNRMELIATGVYAQVSEGIKVLNNDVKNVQGPFPRGQLAQFADCTGSGNQINNNVMENHLGESYSEDAINLFKTSGTVDSPVEIMGNWIRGGGPSGSGGGIMTGDHGGEHILVKDNVLVNPGQYGIAIASGKNIRIIENKIYAKQQSFTNVGIYIWNQSESTCESNLISNNTVYWKNKSGVLNAAWNSGNCGTVEGWEVNLWNANIDGSILPEHILLECN